MPPIEWKPATSLKLSELLAENARGPRQPVIPVGGGTTLQPQSETASAVLLQTRGLQRVVDYPARDMTITVEAGLRVSELRQLLATEHQQLPIDIPQAETATIGGAIACNVSGPGRFGYGTFRDYVLGISAVDGQGRLFSAGGRVVKNVAGYDLCKLLIGSRGTLGVITQVTLKLVPHSQNRTWVLVGSRDLSTMEHALERLNLSATRPIAIDLLNAAAVKRLDAAISGEFPDAPYVLCIGYSGTAAETVWQAETVLVELQPFSLMSPCRLEGARADALRQALTEFQVATAAESTFRVSVLPSELISMIQQLPSSQIAIQAHAASGILIGQLPEPDAVSREDLFWQALRTAADRAHGGFILPTEDERTPLTGVNPSTPAAALMRQLKQTFDPHGVLPPVR